MDHRGTESTEVEQLTLFDRDALSVECSACREFVDVEDCDVGGACPGAMFCCECDTMIDQISGAVWDAERCDCLSCELDRGPDDAEDYHEWIDGVYAKHG